MTADGRHDVTMVMLQAGAAITQQPELQLLAPFTHNYENGLPQQQRNLPGSSESLAARASKRIRLALPNHPTSNRKACTTTV
jgi:hypothetical protein